MQGCKRYRHCVVAILQKGLVDYYEECADFAGAFLFTREIFSDRQEETEPEITKALEKKMDALVMRELYTQYKTAPTEEEKEKARREYLDRRGVPDSFRW